LSRTMLIAVSIIILLGMVTAFVTKNKKPRISRFSFTLTGVMLLFFGSIYIKSVETIILITTGILIAIILKDKNPALSNIIFVIIGLSLLISITMGAVKFFG